MANVRPRRICLIVSSPLTVKAFLLDQITALSRVYDVTLIANFEDRGFLDQLAMNVKVAAVPIERKISPMRDAYALLRLYQLFRSNLFDAIHAITPKASLLAMVSGFLAGVPVRIHAFSGQVWLTRTGISRFILKNIDRLAPALATHTLVDCPSQKDFLIKERFIKESKSTILGNGSICGVDCERFQPNPHARNRVREELGIGPEDLIFLYVGRLNKDKGVFDLARAFSQLVTRPYQAHLLIVGPDEEAMRPEIEKICAATPGRLHFHDYTDTPQIYMSASDILCLPSYREAFGVVIIEAASTGIPAIGSRIFGITDAIIEGKTGLLHEPGNVDDLAAKMDQLAQNRELRESLGRQARERVRRDFPREKVTSALLAYYQGLLADTK